MWFSSRASLEIAVVPLHLKIQCSIGEASGVVVEPAIDRAGAKYMIEFHRAAAHESLVEVQPYLRVGEQRLDDVRVAVQRHALKGTRVVIVVVIESHGQPFQDARGQLRWLDTPLLPCVAAEERCVQILADESQRLLLETRRLRDRTVGERLQEGPGLRGTECFPEELVDREQVDGQCENTLANDGLDAIRERHHVIESTDEVPDSFAAGVEYVRTVAVDEHSGGLVPLREAIAGNVRQRLEYFNFVTGGRQLVGNDRTGKAGPYDTDSCSAQVMNPCTVKILT